MSVLDNEKKVSTRKYKRKIRNLECENRNRAQETKNAGTRLNGKNATKTRQKKEKWKLK